MDVAPAGWAGIVSAADLAALVSPAEYREPRQRLFPSVGSLQWYMRQHRTELVEAGALLMIAGRWTLHADAFDAYVLAAGKAAALQQLPEAA